MVSTYPPMKCGIGTYAFQMVNSLKGKGNDVKILSPDGCEGDYHEELMGKCNILKILKYSRKFDTVILQYHESFFYIYDEKRSFVRKLLTHFGFIILFLSLRKKLQVVIHEIPYFHESIIDHIIEKYKWFFCPKIIFHTKKEINEFKTPYFNIRERRYELVEHHKYFVQFCNESQIESKHKLGLPRNNIIFLCIGFIQPHKGFDRAIKAFQNVNPKMELYVVGSLRIIIDEYVKHIEYLKELAKKNSNTHVIESFLSDDEFDRYINASDIIIIPYREIWSSGVLARAKLYNKPVIATDTGGLANQLGEYDLIFNSDDDLLEIINDFNNLLISY